MNTYLAVEQYEGYKGTYTVFVLLHRVSTTCAVMALDRRLEIGLVLFVSSLVYLWYDSGSVESVVARRWSIMEATPTNYSRIAVG